MSMHSCEVGYKSIEKRERWTALDPQFPLLTMFFWMMMFCWTIKMFLTNPHQWSPHQWSLALVEAGQCQVVPNVQEMQQKWSPQTTSLLHKLLQLLPDVPDPEPAHLPPHKLRPVVLQGQHSRTHQQKMKGKFNNYFMVWMFHCAFRSHSFACCQFPIC